MEIDHFIRVRRVEDVNPVKVREKIKSFLVEDVGIMDLTSESIFTTGSKGTGQLIAKEDGIVAGLQVIHEVYRQLDPSIEVELHAKDGEKVTAGDVLAKVEGSMNNLLTGERLTLNLLQRMSGIATMTKKCIKRLNDPSIHICDTRKTMPGLRIFDKYAVRVGGGKNHRLGLYDGVMIKDNHIAFCGSIQKAVEKARENLGHMVKIEVEVETEEEVKEAVLAKADIIMFDNCSPKEIKEFIKHVPEGIITEASGGIQLNNLANYANTGVDYISLGFLTHSTKALDISMDVS